MANCEKCVHYNPFFVIPCMNNSISTTKWLCVGNTIKSCPGFCRKIRFIPARGGHSKYETD